MVAQRALDVGGPDIDRTLECVDLRLVAAQEEQVFRRHLDTVVLLDLVQGFADGGRCIHGGVVLQIGRVLCQVLAVVEELPGLRIAIGLGVQAVMPRHLQRGSRASLDFLPGVQHGIARDLGVDLEFGQAAQVVPHINEFVDYVGVQGRRGIVRRGRVLGLRAKGHGCDQQAEGSCLTLHHHTPEWRAACAAAVPVNGRTVQ
ncbi:hypothetical protein D3C78_1289390 [compost metagenome]